MEDEEHIVDQDVQKVRLEEADAPVERENICLPVDGFHLNKCESALNGSELGVQDVHGRVYRSPVLHVINLLEYLLGSRVDPRQLEIL